jgi:hypothetical protein
MHSFNLEYRQIIFFFNIRQITFRLDKSEQELIFVFDGICSEIACKTDRESLLTSHGH